MDEKQPVALVISPENIVTKSNSLIEAEYRMSAMEFKVVQAIFSGIQPSGSEQLAFSFPIRQFIDLLGLKGHSCYTELKKITKKLLKPTEVTIDGEANRVSWFQSVDYNDKSGTITIEVNSFWRRFLHPLESDSTSYKLFNITSLSSSYSPRIYELLKSQLNLTNKRRISLLELRTKLGVAENQYPKYANFKQRVLLPAQRELKAESDVYFEFTEYKHGRAVSAIEFSIYRNGIKQSIGPTSIGQTLISSQPTIEQNYIASANKSARREAGYAKWSKAETVTEELPSINPEEFETMLLKVIEIKRAYRTSDEKLYEEIKGDMVNYQKRTERETGNLVSPASFSDPLIRGICIEGLKEILKGI